MATKKQLLARADARIAEVAKAVTTVRLVLAYGTVHGLKAEDITDLYDAICELSELLEIEPVDLQESVQRLAVRNAN